ncbi:HAMP domain-containing sensor histidine kinase [Azospirillum sp. SYSU D00513]|uniref:sensor histidine kinase n=1 Tax=Azospirillum sp. SYSU D00513 TaxID=2812561 RepID=UPI001A972F66|nr:HAMP domain-containing sensor histidine kinase [Azospirillum sp. SYSU D00513]
MTDPSPSTDRPGSREDELAARVAELEEAVRARDDFLAIAAHELRNPMHALSLHLGLAQARAARLADAELIGTLDGAGRSLERYIERATVLLDVSRVNAGQRALHLQDLDLAALVRQVAGGHAAEAAYTGAALLLDLPDSLYGRWDGMAVEQILGNLLSNAIKYGAGGPVEVTLARREAEALLTVRDHGPGIAAEDLERIFGRFEQVVSRAPRAGFGIGLWLVRSLLEAQGGSIAVQSRPGEGAAFTVRLPLDATPFGHQRP